MSTYGKKTPTASSINGTYLFKDQMDHPINEVFTEGSWSVLQQDYPQAKLPSALLHKCKTFNNPNQHHIYHSTTHQIRCTECTEKIPVSVETLWRLINMDYIHQKTYITIFIQSAKNKTDENLGNLNKSRCLKVQC